MAPEQNAHKDQRAGGNKAHQHTPGQPDAPPLSKGVGAAAAGSDTAGTSRSHWTHREPDVVWSHVQRASDVYREPHTVVLGMREPSTTACHCGAQ